MRDATDPDKLLAKLEGRYPDSELTQLSKVISEPEPLVDKLVGQHIRPYKAKSITGLLLHLCVLRERQVAAERRKKRKKAEAEERERLAEQQRNAPV